MFKIIITAMAPVAVEQSRTLSTVAITVSRNGAVVASAVEFASSLALGSEFAFPSITAPGLYDVVIEARDQYGQPIGSPLSAQADFPGIFKDVSLPTAIALG